MHIWIEDRHVLSVTEKDYKSLLRVALVMEVGPGCPLPCLEWPLALLPKTGLEPHPGRPPG